MVQQDGPAYGLVGRQPAMWVRFSDASAVLSQETARRWVSQEREAFAAFLVEVRAWDAASCPCALRGANRWYRRPFLGTNAVLSGHPFEVPATAARLAGPPYWGRHVGCCRGATAHRLGPFEPTDAVARRRRAGRLVA